MSNATKNFDILATSLSVLHNYFSDPYPAKISDLLTVLSMYSCISR